MASTKTSSVTFRVELRLYARSRGTFRTIAQDGLTDRIMYPLVKKWNYIARNRMRLSGELAGSSHEELERMILDYFPREEDVIEDLSCAEVVEVATPFQTADTGWSARLFPWEDALTLVTRRSRDHQLCVVRHLDCDRDVGTRNLGARPSLLCVQSAPGKLAASYNFDSESKLVQWALKLPDGEPLKDPSAAELGQQMRSGNPDIVHISVLDTHVLAELMPELALDADDDGIILCRKEDPPYEAVDYRALAELLTADGTQQPALVSLATCFSGGRMAPLVVGRGATAAIGFRDTLYNTVSEAFFERFYTVWRKSEWDLLAAFQGALEVMRDQDQRYRSMAMFWTAASILPPNRPFVVGAGAEAPAAEAATQRTVATRDGAAPEKVAPEQSLVVFCEPETEINYCALHNGRELFKRFEIKKTDPGPLPPVEINVELTAENEAAVWRHSVVFGDAPGTQNLLEGGVHVPLGSRSFRRVQESTRSSLYVKVTCGNTVRHRETSDVILLPVDQWSDTPEDRRWLPSFVLPRDPAVREIMAGADRYLRALTDDSHAGFDGYQQIDQDPDIVDYQVRAIWCSLLHDRQLRYVNPPPTYTGWSQRLRTPSQVLAEGRGTCIDLSLILASCLEYVGIYPVIILIAGHAFPGWWRSDAAHGQFAGFAYFDAEVEPGDATESSLATTRKDQTAEWMVKGRDGFREVVTPLREGSLAVIESTQLCFGGSFSEAMDAGQDNMMDASIFDALVDVQRARKSDHPVTPLPIVSSDGDILLHDGTTS